MRYWIYDETGQLFRKFYDKSAAENFLQAGWIMKVQPKQKQFKPTTETHGEARW